MTALDLLSWRRFGVLLRALSPQSATVAKISSTREIGSGSRKVNTAYGPKAAQEAFDSIFAGAIARRKKKQG